CQDKTRVVPYDPRCAERIPPSFPPGLPHFIAGLLGRFMTVLALAVNPVPAAATDPAADESATPAVAAAAVDGDTLQLADGRLLRLAAILAPKDRGRLAEAARAALAEAAGRPLLLEFGPRRLDRHGRLLAQAWLAGADGAKGRWLQELLVA